MNVSFLIKPSSSKCNLGCKYCFYKDVASHREEYDKGFMSIETAQSIIAKGLSTAKEGICTFAFQGGEPTLIGLAWYQTFVDLVNKTKGTTKVQYAIQTNGVTIDAAWAEFFKQYEFLVGISIDGNFAIHDTNRVDLLGRGTFKRVMEGAKLLQEYDVDFNVLTVVNNANAKHAKKIYQYFKQHKFRYLQFIPCLDPFGFGKQDYSLKPKAYGEFLCNLFDAWEEDYFQGNYISIRFFDNLIYRILGAPSEACDMNGFCSIQHVIEADGTVFPCDFYVVDAYQLGNITEREIIEFHHNETAKQFIAESHHQDQKCKVCPHQFYCRGGCRRHRNDEHQNVFCESYKIFYGKKSASLERLAASIRTKQGQ